MRPRLARVPEILALASLLLAALPAGAEDLVWHGSLEAGKAAARRSGKPIVCVILKNGSGASAKLERALSTSPEIRDLLESFELVKLDRARDAGVVERYQLRLSPATLILTNRGAPIKAIVGPVSAGKFAAQLEAALEKYRESLSPRYRPPEIPERKPAPVKPPDPVVAPSPRRIDEAARKGAVERALRWLVSKQKRDGRWGKLPAETVTKSEDGRNLTRSIDHIDVALTSMAGLALMAEGSTPGEGRFRANLDRALRFVSHAVRDDGVVCAENGNDYVFLTHANFETPIGALFLAEAYRAAPDEVLRERLARVAGYLAGVQDPRTGAWGYGPDFRDFPDHMRRGWRLLATTHLCLTALNHLRDAGIATDAEAHRRAARYLMGCVGRDGLFTYRAEFRGGPGYPGATGASLYALSRSGAASQETFDAAWAAYRPRYRGFDDYGKHWWFMLFHTALALYRRGPAAFSDFEAGFVSSLVDAQSEDGSFEDPDGNGGSVYATAVAATVLQLGRGRLPVASTRPEIPAVSLRERPTYLPTPHPLSRVKVFLDGGRYRVDLLVTTDGPGDPERLAEIERAIRGADRILFDVTNGQMCMHRVEIRADGRGRDEADILIAEDFSKDEEANPHPFAHGITRISRRTEVRGDKEREGLTIGEWVRLPLHHHGSDQPIRWDSPPFVRVFAHELCHYLFGLKDEYDRGTGRPLCWSIMGNLRSTEFCRDENHSHPTVERSCWSQAKALYPKLVIPEVEDPGPWEPPAPLIVFR